MQIDFRYGNTQYLVTFEDDGKVAYAYIKRGEQILGDVWLYNRCATPQTPEWVTRSNIPFANCRGYMSEEGRMLKTVSQEDVSVDWEAADVGPTAYIYVFDDLYGALGVNDKPGYARFATADGPLAKVMHIEG